MTIYTLPSSTSDGIVRSTATATYADARSGASGLTAETSEADNYIGQLRASTNRSCYEGFFTFDCSGITGSASSAALNLCAQFDQSTTNFVTEVRAHTWSGSGLTTADWVAGASLSGKTLLATWNSADYTDEAYEAFASEAAMLTAVDAHGTLDILLCSAEQTNNSDPTAPERVSWYFTDQTGTDKDPYLEVIVPSGNPWNYFAQLQ